MNVNQIQAAASLILACGAHIIEEEEPVPRDRKIWVKKWMMRKNRSAYNMLLQEILYDADDFRKYLRMNTETFTVNELSI